MSISTNHFNGNSIVGNALGGTYGGGEVIDMENNYWGTATGPTDPSGLNSTTGCTSGPAYVGNLINPGGTGDAINGSGIDYCPFATSPPHSLLLLPDATCYHLGDTVTVQVKMGGQTDVIVGGQFFLGYDTSKLTFSGITTGSAVHDGGVSLRSTRSNGRDVRAGTGQHRLCSGHSAWRIRDDG